VIRASRSSNGLIKFVDIATSELFEDVGNKLSPAQANAGILPGLLLSKTGRLGRLPWEESILKMRLDLRD